MHFTVVTPLQLAASFYGDHLSTHQRAMDISWCAGCCPYKIAYTRPICIYIELICHCVQIVTPCLHLFLAVHLLILLPATLVHFLSCFSGPILQRDSHPSTYIIVDPFSPFHCPLFVALTSLYSPHCSP